MGFMDDVRKSNENKAEAQAQAAEAVASCTGDRYVTEVNKGSINMARGSGI